jgi:16S rRNA (cytidine1402-2'-O)-methyltransferase
MNKKNNLQRTLYLLPVPIVESEFDALGQQTLNKLKNLECFVAESPKTARRILSAMGTKVQEKQFLDINSMFEDIPEDISSIGLISEAGCPCIADPGHLWVRFAHENNWKVVPLAGASSILMALMASGLNGQNFAFNGYLPVKKEETTKMIAKLEKRIYTENQTQIFIETPYRNESLLATLLSVLNPQTVLCVACRLSTLEPIIVSKTVNNWKQKTDVVNKEPCTFVIGKH